MSALCSDCGMDTEPWPPHRGTQEHYLVKDEVWAAAGMPKAHMNTGDLAKCGGGILCVGCIEKRLGRLLTVSDFEPMTFDLLKDCTNTPRLLSRVGVAWMAVAGDPLPERFVERWTEAILTNAIPRAEKVEVNGDEVVVLLKNESAVTRYRAGPKLKAFMAVLRRDRVPEECQVDLLAWE